MRSSIPGLLATAAAVFAGCARNIPIDAKTATLTANRNASAHLAGLAETTAFLKDSKLLGPVFPSETRCETTWDEYGNSTVTCSSTPIDTSGAATRAAEVLARHVFAEGNVEETEETAITYLLRPEVACEQVRRDDGLLAPEPSCAKSLTETPIRLVVTSRTEGDVDVAVLVGASRHNPINLELHRDRVAVEADLRAVRASMVLLAGNSDVSSLPQTMEGRVRSEFERKAPGLYDGEVSILETVELSNFARTDSRFYRLAFAPAGAAWQVEIDSEARSLVSDLDLQAMDFEAALAAVLPRAAPCESGASNCSYEPVAPKQKGVVSLHLGGLSGRGTLDGSADVLQLTGLGLGNETTQVKYEGVNILTVDVNKDAGRRFDLTVAKLTEGTILKMSPKFDLDIGHDLTVLRTQVDDLPSWAMGGHTRVVLDGAASPTLRLVSGGSRIAEVKDGALTLGATALRSPVVVPAGRCLGETSAEVAAGSHPFARLASLACN